MLSLLELLCRLLHSLRGATDEKSHDRLPPPPSEPEPERTTPPPPSSEPESVKAAAPPPPSEPEPERTTPPAPPSEPESVKAAAPPPPPEPEPERTTPPPPSSEPESVKTTPRRPSRSQPSLTRLLQYEGAWIGGTASQANGLRPLYVGVKGTEGKAGRARMAMLFRAPMTGKLDAVAFNLRVNRPSHDSDYCHGGYVSTWKDSCTGKTWTARSAIYCSGGGEYSLGTGGTLRATLHSCKKGNLPDPYVWTPDLGTELGRTLLNGGISEPLVDHVLRDEPYDWWKLEKPVDVEKGQVYAVVVQHECVLRNPSATVRERISVNGDMLRGSDPQRRGGPVFGTGWQCLWDPLGSGEWRPYNADEHEDNLPLLTVRYTNGDAYGTPTMSAQSASRAPIGGKVLARMFFRVPDDYPALVCDTAWIMAFCNKNDVGDLEFRVLRRGVGKPLAVATFRAADFPPGLPSRKSPPLWGGREAPLSGRIRLEPGELYTFEFASPRYGDWVLQAHTVTLTQGLAAEGVRLVNVLPDWKVEMSENGGQTWKKWPGYGAVFPALLGVAGYD